MGYHSCGQSWRVLIFSCTLLLFSLTSPFQLASCNKETKGEEGKVTLSLYYETLCPYCANFIVHELVKVFETDLISIVNLRLVPWGNAQISNNSFVCQVPLDECILNMVDACAINVWPDPKIHFKFIYCVEHLHLEDKHNEWQSCFEKTGLSSEPIRNCFEKQLEVRLELQYADETAQLDPPHTYVPWVLVNDQPLQGVKFLFDIE
ncbi:hypothetical protein Leryth_011623 [Lithospermum erythrorhizon]|nr:hypothetical protein Leryth_011623 [Lithospermum erythrorhizon]